MKSYVRFLALAVVCCVLGGCGDAPQMTSLQLKSLQEREFESSKKTVFASTVSVLQDLGYLIKTVDYKGDEFPKKTTVRLNFVTNDVSEHWFGRDTTEETVILDPVIYNEIFDKIGESIFLREGMN